MPFLTSFSYFLHELIQPCINLLCRLIYCHGHPAVVALPFQRHRAGEGDGALGGVSAVAATTREYQEKRKKWSEMDWVSWFFPAFFKEKRVKKKIR